jgi:hypothetical protein
MANWLAPLFLLVLAALLFGVATRAITSRTGRTTALTGAWNLLVPLGTGMVVLVAGACLDLSLPWLASTAGAAGGLLGLLSHVLGGQRAA